MRIDAHVHFWNYDPVRDAWITEDMGVIKRDFLPEDLLPHLQEYKIDGCVAVQADQSETETLFLLELALQNDCIKGVVGWVNLFEPDLLEERLDLYSNHTLLKGFRLILQSEKPEAFNHSGLRKGIRLLEKRGYTYDVLAYPRHLRAAAPLLESFDRQIFVLDHLAKPYIRRGLIRQWEKDVRRIARRQNTVCKLSGFLTESDVKNWKEADFIPYFDAVFDAFGADRILYGSDWPVCLLGGSYGEQLGVAGKYIASFSADEQKKIMGLNAVKYYSLA